MLKYVLIQKAEGRPIAMFITKDDATKIVKSWFKGNKVRTWRKKCLASLDYASTVIYGYQTITEPSMIAVVDE